MDPLSGITRARIGNDTDHTDPFTLQYVAGHDNIKTTMPYVHPREEAVRKLFVRLGGLAMPEAGVNLQGWVQNPVQWKTPSGENVGNSVIPCNLQPAEVVELADTPS